MWWIISIGTTGLGANAVGDTDRPQQRPSRVTSISELVVNPVNISSGHLTRRLDQGAIANADGVAGHQLP